MQSNQPNYGYSNFDQLHVEKNGFGQERQIQYGYPSFESSDNYDQGQNFTQSQQGQLDLNLRGYTDSSNAIDDWFNSKQLNYTNPQYPITAKCKYINSANTPAIRFSNSPIRFHF
ncbi:hypothetical protein PtA15_9A438 [Puccinia triticina]|uniref:Uncharacterized protein n=1 Tax=Puccinia triticina TaxID=208348 RepID=A0ABY7CSS5_9BASI|nr:uncharacterized protein PtA15_9A438 [Puccinia triticina]WAQ88311.1 hypothetical protein PtA15_9A438 [Puccinia triticina]